MAHRVVSPCFSLKFYRLPTTPQQNALSAIRPLRRFCYFYIRKMVISRFDGYLKEQHNLTSVIDLNVLSRATKVLLHCHLGSLFYILMSTSDDSYKKRVHGVARNKLPLIYPNNTDSWCLF